MRTLAWLMVLALAGSGCHSTLGPGGGDDNGTGGDDDGDGDGEFGAPDGGPACEQSTPITIEEAQPPDLLLVVDKSGSMADPLGTGEQKWAVMRTALVQVVNSYAAGINFGLVLYPLGDECAAGIVAAGVAPSNAGAISGALTLTFPVGGTPTHTTMQGAHAYYNSIPVNPGGRYVLLATDGEPNCGNPADLLAPTVTESIAAIQALHAAGIPTFVLGFGDAINANPATLQAMAMAGGTGNYYAANSPAELAAALDAIADAVELPPCSFTLDEVPADPSKLGVSFDDTPVPRDPSHAGGWDYDPATNSITFYGAACQQIQSGGVGSVNVDYGCGGPIVE